MNNKDAELVYSSTKKGDTCRMRLESKGRGGKQVTVLFDLPFSDKEAKDLLSALQGMLGTGGTYKDGTIEVRGDARDKIEKYFANKKIKVIRAGG